MPAACALLRQRFWNCFVFHLILISSKTRFNSIFVICNIGAQRISVIRISFASTLLPTLFSIYIIFFAFTFNCFRFRGKHLEQKYYHNYRLFCWMRWKHQILWLLVFSIAPDRFILNSPTLFIKNSSFW